LPVISNEGVRRAARRRMRPDARRQSLAGLGPAPRVAAGPGRRHGCRRLPEERRSGWSPVVRPASSIPGPVLPREPVRWRAPPARRARVCRGQAEPTCPRADPPFGRRPAASPLRPTLGGVPWRSGTSVPARGSDVYRVHVVSLRHQLPTVVGVPGW